MSPSSDKEMLSDRDPSNGGGRKLRGSNRPGLSRSSDKPALLPPIGPDFPALFDRGITSMLRTETELGGLGDIVFGNLSDSSSGQHHTQWHGASSSMSATSSMSNPFSRASKPFPGYSSSSSTPRGPTGPNDPQYGSPPAMPNLPSPSSPVMIENRDRDPNRSQSTAYTVQSLNSAPGNRSHTNLRYAYLQPHDSHTRLASHRGGPESSIPNSRSTSSALSDNIDLPSQASQNSEGQRSSTGGYTYKYANTGPPHNSRGRSNVRQGRPHRSPVQPHNLDQMQFRLPHQSSSRSLEDWHGELEPFPPFDDTAYGERPASLHTSKLQSRRNRSEVKNVSRRSETFASPVNHKQNIAVERADSKRFAAGALSSTSTYLRTNSDALSRDTTSFPVSNDGRSVEVLGRPGDMEEMETKIAGSYSSGLCFPAAESMLEATRGESTEKMTDKTARNPNMAASPGLSKEDRVSGGTAGSLGNDSDAPIDELSGNGTPSERHGMVSECAVTSMRSGMKPSPLAARATSGRAEKPWDERSFKSCTGIPHESSGPAKPESGKDREEDSASNSNPSLQQGKYLVDPDTYSCSTAKGADSPDCAGLQSSPQPHPSRSETMGVRNTRMNFGVRSPMSAVALEPSPVYATQDHFPCLSPDSCATCADTSSGDSLRNSQANMREGRDGRVAPGVGVGPRHAPRRSAIGVEFQRNSLSRVRLTKIQEDVVQEESAADLELSTHRYHSQSRYLPNLNEKSHEDSNTPSVFGTQSSIQASGEDLVNFCRSLTVSRRRSDTGSNASHAFTPWRGLPPTQSSQVDLSDELSGNVGGLRHSRSVEQVPQVSQRLNRGSPPRPAAADEAQRQRMSLAEVEEVKRAALSMQPIATLGLSEMRRACSPDLVAEMEDSAVPLVGGLTQSLPESPSSSKDFCKRVESTESPIKEGVDHTHPTQERSSARLVPVPGMPHMVPERAIDNELERRRKNYIKEKGSDASGCMGGGVAAIGASGADAVEELETGNGTFPRQTPRSTAPPTNTQAESSAVTRHRSNALHIQDPRYSSALTLPSSRSFYTQRNTAPPSNSQTAQPAASRESSCTLYNQDPHSSNDFMLPQRSSSRSRTSTSQAGEARPCNPDTDCASAVSTNTAADAFLPRPAAAGRPFQTRSPHIRNRLSGQSGTTAFSTTQTVTASPPHPLADSSTQAPSDHLNIFNNISEPYEAGEQYPTSALSPPTAICSDQLCVSDTDEEIRDITREAREPLCKRILRACDNAYYKLSSRISRAQPSPE